MVKYREQVVRLFLATAFLVVGLVLVFMNVCIGLCLVGLSFLPIFSKLEPTSVRFIEKMALVLMTFLIVIVSTTIAKSNIQISNRNVIDILGVTVYMVISWQFMQSEGTEK
jgi:hypothetical protein